MWLDLNIGHHFPLKFFQGIGIGWSLNLFDGHNIVPILANIHLSSTATSYYLLEQDLIGVDDNFLIFSEYIDKLMQFQSFTDVLIKKVDDSVQFWLLKMFWDYLLCLFEPLVAEYIMLWRFEPFQWLVAFVVGIGGRGRDIRIGTECGVCGVSSVGRVALLFFVDAYIYVGKKCFELLYLFLHLFGWNFLFSLGL